MATIKNDRVGNENFNNKGYLMRVVEYNGCSDIVVEFQDKYKGKVHSSYQKFRSGDIRNPYHPNVMGVGMVGTKYPVKVNDKHLKEYVAWRGVIERCYDIEYKQNHTTYINVGCCEEWLYYENFYDWLHGQENFYKWYNGDKWNIDKDILIKGNKLYSPETCCLVPNRVNKLFIKSNAMRGGLPIGVSKDRGKFKALCNNPFTKKCEFLGEYKNPIDAFQKYKKVKEFYIKQVAEIEYANGNIINKCYNAMMHYEVEITD